MMTFWLNPKQKMQGKEATEEAKKEGNRGASKPEIKNKEKVVVQVFDASGKQVRSFSVKPDTCLNRIYWGLEADGVRFPSRQEPKPDDDLPGGYSVLPGAYKVKMTWTNSDGASFSDSTSVTVRPDPRFDLPMPDRVAQQSAFNDFGKIVEKAAAGFSRLQEVKKTVKLVNESMVNAPDSLKKVFEKLGATLNDSIAVLEKIVMQPDGLKGIQDNPKNLISTLYTTGGHLSSSDGAPNASARVLLDKCRRETGDFLDAVNRFFEKDFSAYRQKVEATKSPMFKNYQTLKLD
jgi:hypothetical protein